MSTTLVLEGRQIPLDKNSYLLKKLSDWSPAVAFEIAGRENMVLTTQYWDVRHLLRNFYEEYGLSPMMRILIKGMKAQLGENKGSSIYLLSLFPEYPALIGSKIAGLPRPTNCP